MVVIIVIFNHCCCCRCHKLAHLVSVKFTDTFSVQIHTIISTVSLCWFSVSWFHRNVFVLLRIFLSGICNTTNRNGTVVYVCAEMGIKSRENVDYSIQIERKIRYMVQWHWILVTGFGFSFKRTKGKFERTGRKEMVLFFLLFTGEKLVRFRIEFDKMDNISIKLNGNPEKVSRTNGIDLFI